MATSAAVDSKISVTSLFGSGRVQVTSRQFGGGRVIAVAGSGEVDLREAALAADGAKVYIVTGLGSVTLRVPDDWAVNVRTVTVLGSVTSKRAQPASPTGQLTVTGLTLLGSVVIRS